MSGAKPSLLHGEPFTSANARQEKNSSGIDQFRSQRRGSWVEKSELDAYLEEELVREDENFEILSWWKTNSNKYPVLSVMARDVLAIPLSTISSESAFSLGGRILSDN
ncbi:zinc finger BED domain-containing protein RICESLEEPER 2-like [Panicum miliaceum]|uniref:Zinc finger BED domain-containing protein RICESLEEPER 2-like n=1 Tax=Panicum miliaceum TaxID=4540 RepID=A0A3L6QC06_PANMI|nr:zinc finger BED domain-containing protein RICESLEEPER 2-like [Panicum miliaceum]